MGQDKGPWAGAVHCGEWLGNMRRDRWKVRVIWAGLFVRVHLGIDSQSLVIRIFSFWCRDGIFLKGNSMTCFEVERGSSESPSCICHFSSTFSSKSSIYQSSMSRGGTFGALSTVWSFSLGCCVSKPSLQSTSLSGPSNRAREPDNQRQSFRSILEGLVLGLSWEDWILAW